MCEIIKWVLFLALYVFPLVYLVVTGVSTMIDSKPLIGNRGIKPWDFLWFGLAIVPFVNLLFTVTMIYINRISK